MTTKLPPQPNSAPILFITRKYPPSVGGMQALCFELYTSLSATTDITLIAWPGRDRYFPLWLPYATFKAFLTLLQKQTAIQVVLLGDGVLAPLGWLLGRFFKVKVIVLLHGLDVIFPHRLYQSFFVPLIRKLDGWIVNSNATAQLLKQRGWDPAKIKVCLPGGSPDPIPNLDRAAAREQLKTFGVPVEPADQVLLSVGRLVKRKGILWFLEHVFPHILSQNPRVTYFILGSGPELLAVQNFLQAHPAPVHLISNATDELRDLLYKAADLFIMPNQPIPGDIEGFGITAVESALRGLPVIASNIEGLQDAVIDGVTGRLLSAVDAEIWGTTIADLIANPDRLATLAASSLTYATNKATWPARTPAYSAALQSFILR